MMADDKIPLPTLAEILGVNIRTIQWLMQEGVLEAHPDPHDKRRKVLPLAASVQAYIKVQTGKENKDARKDRLQQLEEKKLAAEAELKESQRDLHQIRTEIASGRYLSVEEVELDYSRFFVVLKKFLTAIPNRVAGMLSGYVDPVTVRALEKDLSNEITETLRSFVVAGAASGDVQAAEPPKKNPAPASSRPKRKKMNEKAKRRS